MKWELYEGDCLEIMPKLDDKSFDMILCDLPYGTTACKWDSIIPLEPLWNEYKRLIKDNGVIVLTASQPFTSKLISSNYDMFRYNWVWNKKKPQGFFNVKKMPLKNIEDICVFYKKQPKYNPQGVIKINKQRVNDNSKNGTNKTGLSGHNGGKCKGTYTQKFTNYPTQILKFGKDGNIHPTQKPVALFEYLIKTYTDEGDLILDNCAGSGTTGVACYNTNRNCILIEQEPEYYDIIKKRMHDCAKQTRLELEKAG